MRREEWKQANPKDQLIAVIWAAHGHQSNLEDGTLKDPEKIKKAVTDIGNLLDQARELTLMLHGEWPDE